ncbi:5'(3')-deoxyribonucleotidase [Mammaliicoccus sciuri]|uniref:5' nucleotidase, NT5C type n=1 Tax=Mammaliicoccus sciuri TaxID=1296 RepID=UPI002DB6B572|nr:5'(3')-deoxyribonucleotidase [Mammaliicoccus sciuri]MEB7463757.1 5'(3')-deoxyribonucleotidase [Mammaliicoccus sciuri]
MTKQTIGIDMDEVLADTIKKLLRRYNEETSSNVTMEELKGTKIRNMMPEHQGILTSILREDGFFRDLEVFPDGVEVVQKLNEYYDVYIVTAAMDVPTSFADKYAWLREHMPFLDPQHFVFCGDKGIVNTDYLIDDNPKQLESFNNHSIMYAADHNIDIDKWPKVQNWKEVEAYFLGENGEYNKQQESLSESYK